jgi:glycosyltransferase involved in cell wall biosynthesis
MNGPQVVLIYQHFYPDYSAGGPVTSLGNLAKAFKSDVRVIASNKVYSTGRQIEGVAADTWYSWQGVPVWYASDRESIRQALKSIPKGSILYLNGLFLPNYFLFPLRLAHELGHSVMISPRGMLQQGALSQGTLRKKIFIRLLNALWLKGDEVWHATDEEEARDIKLWIRRLKNIVVIPNMPRVPSAQDVSITKDRGVIKLIYYSLIARKKNLSFLLELLKEKSTGVISLDIAGPVKDADYWKDCERIISSLPANVSVKYIGERDPSNVNTLLSKYHLFVLPTLGENFGHAIVESLASFRPVMISDRTPWADVGTSGAGYALPLNREQWAKALSEAVQWDQAAFDRHAAAAMKYFTMKFKPDILRDNYLNLFQSVRQ